MNYIFYFFILLDQKIKIRFDIQGKDGYIVLKSCPQMFDTENAQVLCTVVMNHFESIKIMKGRKQCLSGHQMNLVTVL